MTAPDPFVWHQGGRKKERKVDIRVTMLLAWALGTLWCVTGEDIASWLYGVRLGLCIGLLMLGILVILVFHTWRC